MRGRLIQRFKAEVARLDTGTIESEGHYDSDFRSINSEDSTGDGIGEIQRKEHTAEIIPCQIGSRTWERLRSTDLGNVPRSSLIMYFHFKDLEELSLVDGTTGISLLNVGDRLVSLRDYSTGGVVQTIRTPPGLYIVEANPSGWGINMARPTRNLLRVSFEPRSAVA